ncbi:nucleophile aminohydrolase [Sphaerosporella brunnea]|uniref:Glutathione hydrolase n=1 Tax=Sphaerosporella brunnea TaxID=1250544 RepID=A0A5J5EUX8_9PEZI|nr:nucleophile aminohydrolase [Sphaerosporella brunnea]
MSANNPSGSISPPPGSRRIRFSPEVSQTLTPEPNRHYHSSASSSDDSCDVKTALLPQPTGNWRPRRRRSGRSWQANAGLITALVALSVLFGVIIWENEGSDPLTDDSELLVTGKHGVVSSDVDVCSQIGVDTMKKGGNAVDAAIATAACIGTVNMFASGVGGGGFMVVRMADGMSKSFNFREAAPASATRDMYHKDANLARAGGLAVAIPGEVHGFATAHRMFGKLPWKEVWEPSIKLNSEGFRVTPTLESIMLKEEKFFYENRKDWSFLFSESTGNLAAAGDIMKRPEYAQTLTKIARRRRLCRPRMALRQNQTSTLYHTVVSDTVNTNFLGTEVITCPPPCSGAVMLEGLNIAEGLPMDDPSAPASHHYLVEVMKWLSAGRTELGDPFDSVVSDNALRIAELNTKEYAEAVRANISSEQTYRGKHYNPAYEPNDPKGTSHLSVIDTHGNAVALTTTVNLYWGAKLHDPVTGVVLNSEMDDFSIPGRSNAYNLEPSVYNYIQPFKRPLSSTSPTVIVDHNGEARMVIGGSGGSRIVTGVFEAIIKKLVWGYSALDTIRSPRLHHQLIPEVVYAEEGVREEVLAELEKRGHTVDRKKKGEAAGGSVLQGVWRDAERGVVEGVADWWRKGGKARGY